MRRRLLLLAGALLAGPTFPTRGAGADVADAAASTREPEPSTVTMALVPAVDVDGTGVFLDQVLALNPPAAVPHVRMFEAPRMDQPATLTRAQVLAVLQEHLPALSSNRWDGPQQSRVARRVRRLEETEVQTLLTAAVQSQAEAEGELELRFTRPWTALIVPQDPLTLKVVDLPAGGLAAYSLIRFELLAGTERLGTHQLAVQAKLWREVPVARSTLQRGQLLGDAEVTLERRDVLTLRDPLGANNLADASLELAEAIRAGQPLLTRSVRIRPVIRRGGLVEGVAQDGLLSISLRVEALEDGQTGQTVRVRNPKTRREFLGRVRNEHSVLLLL